MAVALLGLAAGCASLEGRGGFAFGIIGDMPYTKVQEAEYRRVIAELNAADLAFVAHVGDFQFDSRPYNRDPSLSSMPCTDESYAATRDSFQTVRHALVLTPGDNDWTDCWPLKARKVDPLELLAKVRSTFFPEGRSLGQRPIAVRNQSADPKFAKFRENLRWSSGGVTFVTLHIVGSNDNFGRTPEMDAEHRERKAANLAWMAQAFAEAKTSGSSGLVILTQANPGFENFWPPAAKTRYFIPFIARGKPLPSPSTAYREYVEALAEQLESFGRPVAYVHGDTHLFRIDKPLYSRKTGRVFENFTRIETFGWPDSHWVRIEVDPAAPQLFVVKPQIVPENAVSRRTR
ncbi:MAG: hypothetical protein AB1452_02090 [Pseudomonadota bacterium]